MTKMVRIRFSTWKNCYHKKIIRKRKNLKEILNIMKNAKKC